jgi:hypothetical protein
MVNPWLQIPLTDYETHMALPQVGQSQLLSDVFAELLERYAPKSVAMLGCAGGNGFERIQPEMTQRVVGIDVNPEYIEQTFIRFRDRIPTLELFAHDIGSTEIVFEPIDLMFAGLFFEYVDVDLALSRILSWLREDGILATILQRPHQTVAAVTPSLVTSMQTLAGAMTLITPEEFTNRCNAHGFHELDSNQLESPAGKRFQMLTFRRIAQKRVVDRRMDLVPIPTKF